MVKNINDMTREELIKNIAGTILVVVINISFTIAMVYSSIMIKDNLIDPHSPHYNSLNTEYAEYGDIYIYEHVGSRLDFYMCDSHIYDILHVKKT